MSAMASPPNSLSPHASKMPSSPTAKELRRVASVELISRSFPSGKISRSGPWVSRREVWVYICYRACCSSLVLFGRTDELLPSSLSLSLSLSLSRSRTHTHSLSLAHTHCCSGTAQAWTRGQICGGVRLCVLQLPRRRPGGRQASNNVAHRGLPDRALLGQGVAAVREPFDCDDTQRVTQPVLPELWQHGKPVSHQQWPGRMQGPRSQPF